MWLLAILPTILVSADVQDVPIRNSSIESEALALMVAYKCNNPECRAIWDPTRYGFSCPTCGSTGNPLH